MLFYTLEPSKSYTPIESIPKGGGSATAPLRRQTSRRGGGGEYEGITREMERMCVHGKYEGNGGGDQFDSSQLN